MIRTLLLTLVFVGFITSIIAQTSYKTENNVSYRSGENLDEYMKERCKLDIYFPENLDSFTTVVWFHGGGLTGGEKYLPERLKNRKLAIVAVNYRLSPKVKSPAYMWRMMKISGHKQTSLYELDGFNHGGMAEPAFDLMLKILKK